MLDVCNLDLLTIGVVIDMWTEKANDSTGYSRSGTGQDVYIREAEQHGFDVF